MSESDSFRFYSSPGRRTEVRYKNIRFTAQCTISKSLKEVLDHISMTRESQ